MKKFDIKDVFSWSNAEDAKQYIGKYCYFADKLGDLENQVKKDKRYKLQRVSLLEMVHSVFFADDEFWGLCLPADKVKEVEEKKWRAFRTIEEFKKTFNAGIGRVFELRSKEDHLKIRVCVCTGYREYDSKLISFMFGNLELSTNVCFDMYEVFNENTEEWQPFGVEE